MHPRHGWNCPSTADNRDGNLMVEGRFSEPPRRANGSQDSNDGNIEGCILVRRDAIGLHFPIYCGSSSIKFNFEKKICDFESP
jgi:hypothetical protein